MSDPGSPHCGICGERYSADLDEALAHSRQHSMSQMTRWAWHQDRSQLPGLLAWWVARIVIFATLWTAGSAAIEALLKDI